MGSVSLWNDISSDATTINPSHIWSSLGLFGIKAVIGGGGGGGGVKLFVKDWFKFKVKFGYLDVVRDMPTEWASVTWWRVKLD